MKGSVLFAGYTGEVQHGDTTIGVKRVVILWTNTAFIVLGALGFHFYLRSAQVQVLWMLMKCKDQTHTQECKYTHQVRSRSGALVLFA